MTAFAQHRDGAHGEGVEQISVAMSVAMARQLLALAPSLGLPRQQLLKVMNSSSGQNWLRQNFEGISSAKQAYAKSNAVGILEKDVAFFAEAIERMAGPALQALREALSQVLSGLKAHAEHRD